MHTGAPPSSSPSIITRFGWVIEGLLKAVGLATRFGLDGQRAVDIWNRLQRIRQVFLSVAARVQAGTWRSSPPRAPRLTPRPPPRPPDPMTRPLPPTFPHKRAWLAAQVQGSAVFGNHLRILLDDPRMAELVAASPRLRGMLRNLLLTLGSEPHPALAPPPRRSRLAEAPRPEETGSVTDAAGETGSVTDAAGETGSVTDAAGETGDAPPGRPRRRGRTRPAVVALQFRA